MSHFINLLFSDRQAIWQGLEYISTDKGTTRNGRRVYLSPHGHNLEPYSYEEMIGKLSSASICSRSKEGCLTLKPRDSQEVSGWSHPITHSPSYVKPTKLEMVAQIVQATRKSWAGMGVHCAGGNWIIMTKINSLNKSEREAERYLRLKFTAKAGPLASVEDRAEDCLRSMTAEEDKRAAIAQIGFAAKIIRRIN